MSLSPPTSNAEGPAPIVGGGLIEIAALTALIGSTTAESLMLGNKGAAGLVWGTMSIFGALSVIRACVSAATPDWLRETLGVRSPETDAAVGLSLDLDVKSLKGRSRIGGALGVSCANRKGLNVENDPANHSSVLVAHHDIYAFDRYTSGNLEVLPETNSTENLLVYVLAPDIYLTDRMGRDSWFDSFGILVSSAKLLEVAILWRQEAINLCLISGCSWLFFFLGASILQILGLSRKYSEDASKLREMDIVAGQLPTAIKPGGMRRILLGAPRNVRRHIVWRIFWILGSLVCTTAVIATYLNIGQQRAHVFVTWAGFQFFWLAIRSVFYHFTEGIDSSFHHPSLLEKDWAALSVHLKMRIRNLVFALSKYQMHVHPRGRYSYEEDLQVVKSIENVHTGYPLAQAELDRGTVDLHIMAVIGDTMLSSAAWMFGHKLSGMDLYDSCIVILALNGKSIAIPSARVLTDAAPPRRADDVEVGKEPIFSPKGGSNRGRDITWWYWIPCGQGRWLQLSTTDMRFRGEHRTASILSDDQVTKKLRSGDLIVGISEVAHVKDTIRASRTSCEILQNLLS